MQWNARPTLTQAICRKAWELQISGTRNNRVSWCMEKSPEFPLPPPLACRGQGLLAVYHPEAHKVAQGHETPEGQGTSSLTPACIMPSSFTH